MGGANGSPDGRRASPSASAHSPRREGESPCEDAGDRAREPEGRGREDDDDAESRGRVRREGLRVLCIDLDPQGNLTMSQGMNPDTIERSMFDVLVHRLPITEVIATREVDIAVASIDLAGADMALSSQIGRERALQKALDPVKDELRLHPDRHAAVARPADDQRVRRGDGRDRPGSDRVPLAARPRRSSRTPSRWCGRT